MSNHEENRDVEAEDSDSDDDDYVPDAEDKAQLSEEDSDAAVDEDAIDSGNEDGVTRKRKSKGKRNGVKSKKSKTEEVEVPLEITEKKQEDAKKKAEDIWAAFKKDTDFIVSKPASKEIPKTVEEEGPSLVAEKKQPSKQFSDKKEEPKIFEFAGETLVMSENSTLKPTEPPKASPVPSVAPRRGVGGGLSGLISQIKGKGTKLSTLEKSQMDWQNFKSKEGITEEIQTHNRGKQGYLERQDFLERADHRQFEIEKQMRATVRRTNR